MGLFSCPSVRDPCMDGSVLGEPSEDKPLSNISREWVVEINEFVLIDGCGAMIIVVKVKGQHRQRHYSIIPTLWHDCVCLFALC